MWPSREHLFMLVFLACCCGSAFGDFFAVAPNEFRPGWNLSIAVTAHKNAKGRVFINAVLSPKNDKIDNYKSVAESLNPGETKLMTMMIPKINPAPSQAILTVTATGAVKHTSEVLLKYNPTTSLVFVETDKAIYKPGQKVQIRVVHVDKGLKAISNPLTVSIMNPKESKLEEYKAEASKTGVTEMTYELLQSASLGKWKVHVTDNTSMQYSKEFTVEEYVLPKFSVTATASPGYIVFESGTTGSSVTVEAKYTYGRGVQGKCDLALSADQHGKEIRVLISKQLNEAGKAVFTDLEWSKFANIQRNVTEDFKVQITASVTDETGRTEAGQTSVMFHKYSIKVTILPKSTRIFRSGIPAAIFVRVSDHSGNPVDTADVHLEIHVPGIKKVYANLSVPAGETDGAYHFTPEPQYKDEYDHVYHHFGYPGTIMAKLTSNSEIVATLYAYSYQSMNKSVVTVQSVTDKMPKVGETVQYKVVRNSNDLQQHTVSYVVVSQGSIVEAGVPVGDVISIVPTLEMCPQAKLLVYMIVGDQKPELVTDVLDFSPTHCLSKEVGVSFNVSEIRSGANTTMNVHVNRVDGSNALPGTHHVYYLGIDKSLVLLQGRTDLNKDEVMSGMSNLNLKSLAKDPEGFLPHSAIQMIEGSGLAAFTSVLMQIEEQHHSWESYHDDMTQNEIAFGLAPVDDFNLQASGKQAKVEATEEAEEPVTTKVRKNFPETWLWGSSQTDEAGRLRQPVTLPDTITTWLVSAFAVSDEGLAVGSGPFELAAFQVFFLTMNLPYSIKRGEVFVLRVTVFNYKNQGVNADVRLSSNSQFSVVDDDPDDAGWITNQTQIPAGRASSVEFKINATSLGLIELRVIAEDTAAGVRDEVLQKLLVKPEGEMRSRAITQVFFLKSEISISDRFVLNWPEDKIVPESKRVEVKITGVVLGQALSNLQRLVTMPCGCGEQNMITTVPNIYGLTYIKATADNQPGHADLVADMMKNMKTGYQRQVDMYRHGDGSYSAWGHGQTQRGSVWLTAFVLKSFSRAAEFISIDSTVLSSAAKFLSSAQQPSGAFIETGQVFHSEMQSGTGSGPSLTLYVLISLLEADQAMHGDLMNLKTQIDLAVSYIQQNLDPDELKKNSNMFLAAVGAYAVSLIPGNKLASLVDELLSVVIDQGAPWAETSSASSLSGYERVREMSRSIEIAAYYLLTLTRLERHDEGLTIMKWLQSQQNSLGGYYSTQDTVMALQALAEFGAAFKGSTSASLVSITEPESGQSFNVSLEGSKAMLLQTVELPEDTNTVEVTVTGPPSGSCIVKVVYTYYTLAGDDDQMLEDARVSVKARTWKLTDTVHNVEACVSSSGSLEYSGMFVATLTLPSGEEAFDEPSAILANNPRASRVETSQGVIHFYMNEAPGEGYCLNAKLERHMEFEVQKPGSAKIYAYYEPGTAQEVALLLDDSLCSSDTCGGERAFVVSLTNILLTLMICLMANLLLCM
ncbi:hypothetical protein BsWGS_22767 [Bradybaena similaris]